MKEIQLTKGKVAIVDDADYERVMALGKWCCVGTDGYAGRTMRLGKKNGKWIKRHLAMHRFIMNCPEGSQVDHINGDIMDNRKSNLRICSHSDNMKNRSLYKNNSSGYKGVYLHKAAKKWAASIRINKGKRKHLGLFDDCIEAARAYNEAALIHHGEFARLNEIPA